MKYKIEKNTVQETLVIPLYPGNYARNCTQTFFKMKRRYA